MASCESLGEIIFTRRTEEMRLDSLLMLQYCAKSSTIMTIILLLYGPWCGKVLWNIIKGWAMILGLDSETGINNSNITNLHVTWLSLKLFIAYLCNIFK